MEKTAKRRSSGLEIVKEELRDVLSLLVSLQRIYKNYREEDTEGRQLKLACRSPERTQKQSFN